MHIISHKFFSVSQNIIFSLKTKEIKNLIHRDRLKFSYSDIHFYIYIIFLHQLFQQSFFSLHSQYKKNISYQAFMKNIALFSQLYFFLFNQVNKQFKIKSSSLLNIVDSTLIPEKKLDFITQTDWNNNRVTTRSKINEYKQSVKYRICGSKGLFFINRFKQIYLAKLLNINDSDQNILKDTANYSNELKGILLADRGFNNKTVRKRFNNVKNSIFQQNKQECRLISPTHYKEKEKLTKKEIKLYKRRWKIETLFQKLKHNYSVFKLNLTGNYKKTIKQAKFYATLIHYNLTTTI